MTELISAVLGFALASVLGVRSLRALRAVRDAWQRNYRAECRRHDLTLAQTAARTKQMQAEREVAAAQIWMLTAALSDATAQVQMGRADGVRMGADMRQGDDGLLARFCRN